MQPEATRRIQTRPGSSVPDSLPRLSSTQGEGPTRSALAKPYSRLEFRQSARNRASISQATPSSELADGGAVRPESLGRRRPMAGWSGRKPGGVAGVPAPGLDSVIRPTSGPPRPAWSRLTGYAKASRRPGRRNLRIRPGKVVSATPGWRWPTEGGADHLKRKGGTISGRYRASVGTSGP